MGLPSEVAHLNDRVASAKAAGRADPARDEPVLAPVRAAWGREVVGPADHPRPSGLSSMP